MRKGKPYFSTYQQIDIMQRKFQIRQCHYDVIGSTDMVKFHIPHKGLSLKITIQKHLGADTMREDNIYSTLTAN